MDTNKIIQSKINCIEEMLSKLENSQTPSPVDILKNELSLLREQVSEFKAQSEEKKVIGKEEKSGRTRYYLKDGSVYVVKGREYKYLYDSKTKTVTYEFGNGQVERTFESGLKEIRKSDGTVIIKTGPKEYDYLNK